jgi:hypothetical protein
MQVRQVPRQEAGQGIPAAARDQQQAGARRRRMQGPPFRYAARTRACAGRPAAGCWRACCAGAGTLIGDHVQLAQAPGRVLSRAGWRQRRGCPARSGTSASRDRGRTGPAAARRGARWRCCALHQRRAVRPGRDVQHVGAEHRIEQVVVNAAPVARPLRPPAHPAAPARAHWPRRPARTRRPRNRMRRPACITRAARTQPGRPAANQATCCPVPLAISRAVALRGQDLLQDFQDRLAVALGSWRCAARTCGING